ncbi:hypothetical protein [Mesonia sp. K7]|uniref:hypothetical protein n=1 Tax=Mesonia sp. K7 TaxID=2218606 RepID=UPI000DA6EE8C|nr:hypothetical protein [Mesonia sp. K7]PZD76826.1 hypothetical protein DNG35_10750 [Mesonia sp. K7]
MKENFYIQGSVIIRNDQVFKNGDKIFQPDINVDRKDFLKAVYTFLEISYPKFHKMDDLCKLGILATEILQQNKPINSQTGLVFQNKSGSLVSDFNHQQIINDFASPAIFVYTLPNIVMGEVCIMYQLNSENFFFINPHFDCNFVYHYTQNLLENKSSQEIVCGWVEVNLESYDIFLCRVNKEKSRHIFTPENLKKAYHNNE